MLKSDIFKKSFLFLSLNMYLITFCVEKKLKEEAIESAIKLLDKKLHENIELMKKVISVYGVNCQNIHGSTLLLLCTEMGYEKHVQFLLNSGADPNLQNKDGKSPLHYAAYYLRINIIELLLKFNANINIQNNKKETPLMHASKHGFYDVVALLINNGANPNIQDEKGDTALIMAVKNNNNHLIKLLLESGADANIMNINGDTALLFAIQNNNKQIVELLKLKTNLDLLYDLSGTALIYSLFKGHKEIAKILLKAGAKPYLPTKKGYTPYEIAEINGFTKIADLIRKYENYNIMNQI